MKMTFLKTIGLPIISEQAEGPVAFMKEVLINPETGAVMAISLVGSKKVISIADIRQWSMSGIRIVDETAIIDRSELIKLSEFSEEKVRIFAKQVAKEDGRVLGIVHDFVVDTQVGQLTQLYVVKKAFFFFTVEKRIIDYREIVEILEDTVIVKNDLSGKKERIEEFFELRDKVKIMTPARYN